MSNEILFQTWKELRAGLRVLRCGSKVVCRKPRLQAADPTLKEIVKLVFCLRIDILPLEVL